MADLILGTAGHIDHGKTSLVHALTGVNTDRLPEEKKRGITIDIGFAELQLGEHRLGIVDVPGHERFVRNMLAGATGIDLALLVVAADDSIKPQTREHLEILRLLNLDFGVIALTKVDLVEPDWLAMVSEEVRELVAGSFLENAPLVGTSSETGEGIDQLRAELKAAADRAAESDRLQRAVKPFRMPIDRSFTIAGHGAVVTGSVVSGRLRVGDELVIQPGGASVRVRGIQNHDQSAEETQRGQRAAINLAGVKHDELHRGQELSAPGYLTPSKLLTVEVSVLEHAPRPLKNRSRVRLHVGAAEVLCSIRLLDRKRLEPGEGCHAQLFLNEPVVVTWNQPFVLRSESPVTTIGGGHILDPNAERLRKPDATDLQMVAQLRSTKAIERASAAVYLMGLRDWRPIDLARQAGVDDVEAVMEELGQQELLTEIQISVSRSQRLHAKLLELICGRIEQTLKRMHDENPLRSMLDRSQLMHHFAYLGSPPLLERVLEDMRKANRIRLSERGVALVGQGPKLSQNEQRLLQQIVDHYREAGIESPTVKQCQDWASKNKNSVPQLVALAAANGELVEISADYFLHCDVERGVREQLTSQLEESDGLTLSQIREILNTTRKYAIPLCEYFDNVGFTLRQGDLRILQTADQT